MRNKVGVCFHPDLLDDMSLEEFIEILTKHNSKHIMIETDYLDYADKFVEEGFSIAFHGPLGMNFWEYTENEMLESLATIFNDCSKTIRNTSEPVYLIWHAGTMFYSDEMTISRSKLFNYSVEYLRLVNRIAREYFENPILCIENMVHGKSKMRIGDTIKELIELRNAIGFDDVKFCWDIGHLIMGLRHLGESEIPKEFLKNVAYVHLHGVEGLDREKQDWMDHYFLNANNVPWQKYLDMLKTVDYSGPILLEIFRTNEGELKSKKEQMHQSIEMILNS